jgi:hypothetical protein
MGFVGKKNQSHSNQSSLYLTLSPLTLFDTLYSECGRVLSSLRSLESVDLHSLQIYDVIPLFSYKKKSEFSKIQLLRNRCKFFQKKVNINGNHEFENFIFETTESESQFLTGPESMSISNVTDPDLLIKLREINLTDLKEFYFTNCKLSKNLFKKLIKESEYIPKLAKLSLRNISIDQWCFSIVCRLKLDELILDRVTLLNSKIRLFPLLCLESEFFPNLKSLTFRNNLIQKDLNILDENFLTKWITIAGDQSLSSVNLNRLNSKSNINSGNPLNAESSGGKPIKTSSTKKSNSKTSRKSGNKKSEGKTLASKSQEAISNHISSWIQKLNFFGSKLEHLDLNYNSIYDEGLEIILQKLTTTKLKSISLKNTKITSQSNSFEPINC